MDKLDIQIQQKKFFKVVYGDLVGDGNNLKENNYIRIFQAKDDFSKIEFFNNIDDLVQYTTNKVYDINTYFTLSTTDGESGQEKDLLHRTVLAFDFDKKDLGQDFTYKDVLERFKSIGLWYHCLVDSGHGYHAYICIEPTTDLTKVAEVQKAMCEKLGADKNAIKSTQVLRVPYSYNVKDKPKRVNIIKMYEKDTIKRYSIDKLYNKYCNTRDKEADNRATQYTLNNTNIPKCIQDILNNGSPEGARYEDLQKIVVLLRQKNKPIGEIKAVCKEWANKSNYKDNIDYRIEHIYNNLNYVSMDCKECKHRQECFSIVVSDFQYSHDDKLITMNETHASKLKCSKRKGAKIMKSNDLLVYSILKCHDDGLTKDEIMQELTYTKKKQVKNVAMSDKTLREALKSLEDNGFIEIVKGNPRAGIPNIYKLKECTNKIELTYNVSYAAAYECIKGNISTEELRLYNYMRYRHHKEQRENPKALKGNLFQFNQVELAKELGLTQGRISQMINNLLEEKLLGIWYRQPSKNNGFEYYIYRLIY